MKCTFSRRLVGFVAAIAVATLAFVLPGCGRGEPEADFVFITGSEHNYLDPQKISWVHDGRIAHALFEPLVRLDYNTLTHEPGVATRWTVSDDGLTYTFHLRPEARWSNGDPVTAGDFVYAWRRALLPDSAADYSQKLWSIRGGRAFFDWRTEQLRQVAEGQLDPADAWAAAQQRFDDTVGLHTPDDHTLVVELDHPVPYFLSLAGFTTFLPVHAASVEANTTIVPDTGMVQVDPGYWTDPERLVTNGPYHLAGRRFQQYVHLLANDHYWAREQVQSDSILERIITDPQNALLTYEGGGAHFWPDAPTASSLAADLLAQDRHDVHAQNMAGTYFYNFNCLPTRPDGSANPLADARVRRALSMAIDRTTLVERVTRLSQPIATTFVPPDALRDYEPPVDAGIRFDPDAARALLAEAGYEGGQGLDDLSIIYNTGHGHDVIAQAVKAMWEQHLGVVVTLEPLEGKTFSDRLKRRDYSIARASWFGDYPDPTTWLLKMTTDDGNNDCGWSNAEYDALLERAATERDPEQRMALLREAETILVREAPMALMFHYVSLYLWDPDRVTGLTPNPWARWELWRVKVLPGQ